ncbi:MAG: AMP-binding protein [Beijerinckiaceae bacterium]|jgi:hypothetical protein|nr:AMP-binding protein [Beijerinckiaceae bacterium]
MSAPHANTPPSPTAKSANTPSRQPNGTAAGSDEQASDLLGFDLVSLTSSAAQLRARQLAFAQEGRNEQAGATPNQAHEFTYAAFQSRVHEYSSAMRAFGLQAGERILVPGGLSVQSIAAIIAGLAAGLDCAIVGTHLDSDEIGAFARAAGASALVSDVGSEDTASARHILSAAAKAETVRLVISLSDNPPDGTVPVRAAAGAKVAQQKPSRGGRIITRTMDGTPAAHSQQCLICAGLDFIAQARLSAGSTIVSTILPTSFAGLVCGPIAGLLTGAPTVLHAPFDSQALVRRIAGDGPVQLIVPAAIGGHIAGSGFFKSSDLSALVLLSRFEARPAALAAPELPALQAEGIDISDLLAYDEVTAFAQLRGNEGRPSMPLERNHTIHMGGRHLVTVGAVMHMLETNGIRTTAAVFDGAAVSKGDWKFYESAE